MRHKTEKTKRTDIIKLRDLKPSKDAKAGSRQILSAPPDPDGPLR